MQVPTEIDTNVASVRTEGSSPSSEAWSNIEDPISWDFFGFEFDFTGKLACIYACVSG